MNDVGGALSSRGEVSILSSYGDIPAEAWDALVGDASPFLEHTFLWGLERTGCAIPETGWTPRPVVVRDADGALVAAAPAWVKTHSMGEFVYDHAWADAASRAGIPYYPKLVVGVPFTPVTGARLLVRADVSRDAWLPALLAGLEAAVRGTRGLHILFNPEAEAASISGRGLFTRLQYQFHWKNEGYTHFDDFLSRFRSKHRNKIRRERRITSQLDIRAEVGPDLTLLAQLHTFYQNTCAQFGPWGRVYLSPAFFAWLGEHWSHRLHTVVAREDGQMVAGTLNVVKGDRLYGRYWGCTEPMQFLHFEVCYYQAIAWVIREGLSVFEPGHGGGHKYRRGFIPTITSSSHALVDPRLHDALARHAASEAMHVREQVQVLRAQSPLRTE